MQKSNTLTKLNDKIGPNACPNLSPIQTRLICPVMPNELKQIDQRQKCFMKLSTDNYIRYFVSRPQVWYFLLTGSIIHFYCSVVEFQTIWYISLFKDFDGCCASPALSKSFAIWSSPTLGECIEGHHQRSNESC